MPSNGEGQVAGGGSCRRLRKQPFRHCESGILPRRKQNRTFDIGRKEPMARKSSMRPFSYKNRVPKIACFNCAKSPMGVDFDALIAAMQKFVDEHLDRKSTRLNSSHLGI